MRQISKWAIAGMIAGAVFAIGSFIRYYVIYQDLSEMIIGVSIGVLMFAVSFLYNRVLQQGNTILALEEYMADKNGK